MGLIGQLLDTMHAMPKPKKVEDDRRDAYRDAHSESKEDEWMML